MAVGDLKYQFTQMGAVGKLILINVAVFILDGLITFFFQLPFLTIKEWFWLPKDLLQFLGQPWGILSYSFFHNDILHIFFNMLILYFSGRIISNLFGDKRFLTIYFLGVILGGLFFMLSYNLFPVFLDIKVAGVYGASAGAMATLIFICAYLPNKEVRVIFFTLKLWHIGVFFVVLDLVQIPTGDNAGGRLAHLGGALLGYVYATQLGKGRDIGSGFSNFVDGIVNAFKKKEKKAPLKTVYRSERKTAVKKTDFSKETKQRKIDNILDKISKSGYESLSKAEKDFLFKAGKED